MKRIYTAIAIIVTALIAGTTTLSAITAEREQQFTYYWYEAKQCIDREEYDRAMMLLLFCEALNPEDAQTKDYIGMMYNALKEEETALQYFAQAYQLAPEEQWQHYATGLYNTEDPKKQKQAVKILETASKHNPKDDEVWEQLIEAYAGIKQYNKALKAQDRLDAIQGYDSYSAINRYRLYILQGKIKKALAEVDKYLELEPRDLRFQGFRIELYEHIGNMWDKLQAAYEEYIKQDPYNTMILNNYAYGIAIRGGDLRKAEQMSQKAISESPDNATYLDTYAWIMHLQGQKTLAQFYIKKALDNAKESEKKVIEEHYKEIYKQGARQ